MKARMNFTRDWFEVCPSVCSKNNPLLYTSSPTLRLLKEDLVSQKIGFFGHGNFHTKFDDIQTGKSWYDLRHNEPLNSGQRTLLSQIR